MKPAKYQIVDNFLVLEDFKKLKADLQSEEFPWYFGNFKVKNGEELRLKNLKDEIENKEEYSQLMDNYNFQFVHPFYKKSVPCSEHINVLEPIFNKIKMDVILRIKANLTPKTKDIVQYDFHNDTKVANATTAVFYLNTNNGYTLFDNGEKVPSIENRIVFFDARELHCGTSCSDSENRIVLNINYISA